MACNCRKSPRPLGVSKKESVQTFELVQDGKRVETFGSRLEAEAQARRSGKGGVVRPASER